MQIQTTRLPGAKIQRRLVSYGHLRSIPGSDPVSVDYYEFERQALYALSEISLSDLMTKKPNRLELEVEQELRGVAATIEETQHDLADPANRPIRKNLLATLGILEERRKSLEGHLDELRSGWTPDMSIKDTRTLSGMLQNASGDDLHALRLEITFRDQRCRGVHPRQAREALWEGIRSDPDPLPRNHLYQAVLRGIEGCQGEHPGPCALGDRQGTSVLRRRGEADDGTCRNASLTPNVPDSIGKRRNSGSPYARHRCRGEFRVLPSKIERFLAVVGDRIDADPWELWVRTLRLEVREGNLSRLTARVALGRSREFVRWLIEHGKLADIPGLRMSGEKALGLIGSRAWLHSTSNLAGFPPAALYRGLQMSLHSSRPTSMSLP